VCPDPRLVVLEAGDEGLLFGVEVDDVLDLGALRGDDRARQVLPSSSE
jgi:hypothetical protein